MLINIEDDFNLEKIAISGQCFRPVMVGDDTWRFIINRNILFIKQVSEKEYDISVTLEEWNRVWHGYFDMSRSYSSIRASIRDDEYLQAASEYGKGIRILRQDPWEMLITFIISQRKNIPAIRKSVELLSAKFGERLEKDRITGDDIYAFPEPAVLMAAGEGGLSDCSLGYRLPYILDAAARVSEGSLDLTALQPLPDEELFEALKTVKGVGDKVSNCICLFGYGRTGRAPVDVWIKRVIDEHYSGENPFPKFGNDAGIMQQYIFFTAQTGKA